MTQASTDLENLPYRNKGDLTNGGIGRHLVRLTLPMIWGLLAVISVQLVDTYFIGLLGTQELAGVSFTFPVTMIITHFIFGLNIAMSSVISRMIGEKKRDDAKRIVMHGLITAFVSSLLMAALCYIFLEPLFSLLGADGATMNVVKDYMPIWLLGSILLSIPMNSNSAIRAAGDSFTPAMVMTSMALTNLILDPILIFGYFGAPEMGVKGAATASAIAYFVSFLIGTYVLIFKKDLICRDGLHMDKFADSLRRLSVIAIPAGITNIIQPLTNAIIVALLAQYGSEAVAAFGIATRVEAFALLIIISLALGMAPIVGQNWGAKNYQRVHQTINLSIGFNFLWSFFVAAILAFFAREIASAFSQDPQVIFYTVLFFWLVPFSYAFGNLVFGWGSAFNAIGMPQRAFVMIIVKSIILTLPAVYIGSWFYGVKGIFLAMASVNVTAGLFFHILSWRKCMSEEYSRQEQKEKKLHAPAS